MQNREKSYSQIKKDQLGREGDLLSQIMGSSDELKALSGYDSQMTTKRNEILFKVTTEMEDTKNALKEAQGLVDRLKKHLAELEGMHKILTRK